MTEKQSMGIDSRFNGGKGDYESSIYQKYQPRQDRGWLT
jgi:hypothetical protein